MIDDPTGDRCVCITWAREASMTWPRHHLNCIHYDPSDVLPLDILNYLRKMPDGGAVFSDDRKYRYLLWRRVGEGNRILHFIGLNPSKAGETENDHTIRREMHYTREWGFDVLFKTNLFGFCATDPKVMIAKMKEGVNIIGRPNDDWINQASKVAQMNVAAWGVGGDLRLRASMFLGRFGKQLHVFGLTKGGHPKHPARLPNGLKAVEWKR